MVVLEDGYKTAPTEIEQLAVPKADWETTDVSLAMPDNFRSIVIKQSEKKRFSPNGDTLPLISRKYLVGEKLPNLHRKPYGVSSVRS